jgi:hypothetical protein
VDKAKDLYDYFYSKMGALYAADRVKNGVFQAMMEVASVNDGPVRILRCCLSLARSNIRTGNAGPGGPPAEEQSGMISLEHGLCSGVGIDRSGVSVVPHTYLLVWECICK